MFICQTVKGVESNERGHTRSFYFLPFSLWHHSSFSAVLGSTFSWLSYTDILATLHRESTLIENVRTRAGSWRETWSCRVVTSKLMDAKLFAWKWARTPTPLACARLWDEDHCPNTSSWQSELVKMTGAPFRFIAAAVTLFCKSDLVAETVSLGSGEMDGRLLASPHPSAGGVLPTTPERFRNSLCRCSFCSFAGVWRRTRSNCKAKGNTHAHTHGRS